MAMDLCTTMAAAPLAAPGFWQFGGVSRGLSVTYLRPAPSKGGEEVVIECEVLQIGKRLATIKGEMKERKKGGEIGEILALCEHNKVSIDFKA